MTYGEAIRDAVAQKMVTDDRVFVLGIGVTDPKGVFGSTTGLLEQFGADRILETPASENATVGICIGASLQGMRPVMVSQRVDFTLLALDQVINHAAKWKWMFGGAQRTPIVIRMIVGRGWGQGPQHSQSMHALFAHIPGLKVVAPASAYDAKGLLISSIEDDDPVIFIEHRRLYDIEGDVPDGLYRLPIGRAAVLQEGTDITVVAVSQMVLEAQRAAAAMSRAGVSVEVIDLRSLRPLDSSTVLDSIHKTGRLIVVEADWRSCSVASEIVALAAENSLDRLKSPPVRLTWPDAPAPTSASLEAAYYPTARSICEVTFKMLGRSLEALPVEAVLSDFFGPF